MLNMVGDNREIQSISFPDESNINIKQGEVDRITAYQENGNMAPVIWFAIYRNGAIDQRINAVYVESVNYT